jgi:hypothetical protein
VRSLTGFTSSPAACTWAVLSHATLHHVQPYTLTSAYHTLKPLVVPSYHSYTFVSTFHHLIVQSSSLSSIRLLPTSNRTCYKISSITSDICVSYSFEHSDDRHLSPETSAWLNSFLGFNRHHGLEHQSYEWLPQGFRFTLRSAERSISRLLVDNNICISKSFLCGESSESKLQSANIAPPLKPNGSKNRSNTKPKTKAFRQLKELKNRIDRYHRYIIDVSPGNRLLKYKVSIEHCLGTKHQKE